MTDSLPDDLNEPIWFEFSGHKDTPDDIEDNVNSISGRAILAALKAALLDAGWSESTERYDSEVFAEDWGWCVFLCHEDALMMLGMYTFAGDLSADEDYQEYLQTDWTDGGVLVEHFHKRSLMDRLRGRNKADPKVHEKAYQSVWDTLSGLDYIRNLSFDHPEDR